MLTTVEISVLSLLILYHVQDFFMNMFKEDLDQNEFPDQDNISHYIITGVKIITDSILYSTVIIGGFLIPDSFQVSLNKLLIFMGIGCLFLFTSGLVSSLYLTFNSFGSMNNWLNIFLNIFTLCNNLLLFFNVFFKSLVPIILVVFCKFSINLVIVLLSSNISPLIINICTSLSEICVHLGFIFVLHKSSLSLDLHVIKEIFCIFILFVFNSIFTRAIFQFGYISLLSSEFMLFWSSLVFHLSYCYTLFSPFLEFLRFVFCRSNLDYCKIIFLFILYNLSFFLPLVFFIVKDFHFLIPFQISPEFSHVCAVIIPLNYVSCSAQVMNMYFLSKSRYSEVILKDFVLNLLSMLMFLLFFFDIMEANAFLLIVSLFVIRCIDFPLSLCLFVKQRCHF